MHRDVTPRTIRSIKSNVLMQDLFMTLMPTNSARAQSALKIEGSGISEKLSFIFVVDPFYFLPTLVDIECIFHYFTYNLCK